MDVRKAIIPAAGYGTRLYPQSKILKKELFPIVDLDGLVKPVIQLIIEEALDAGVLEVGIVVRKEDIPLFQAYFNEPASYGLRKRLADCPLAQDASARLAELAGCITYIEQEHQLGFGHAVHCARKWVGNEPFLLLLGDHVYTSSAELCCAKQLINTFYECGGNTFAVTRTPEDMLHLFGTVGGHLVDPHNMLYAVDEVKEKPSVEYALDHLQSSGVPLGMYLCFFGQYALLPNIFDYLKYLVIYNETERGEIQLTTALAMAQRNYPDHTYACEIQGQRYDIGVPISYGNTVASFVGHI